MYRFAVKRILLPFGETLRGSRVLPRLRELEKSQWYSPERIRELQKKKLRRLVRHTYDHVPYYRRVFGERGLGPDDIVTVEDLTKLPILTKKEARKQYPDQISADNCRDRDYLRLHSSGSTGEPFHFYLSKAGHDARLAAMFRYWRAAGYDFGEPWVRIGNHPHKATDRVSDRLLRCTYLQLTEATETYLLELLDQIRQARPTIIRGYAPSLFLLASTARDHDFSEIRVKATMSTGAMLYEHYRELVETQFHCPVYDVYGGEGMIIAGQFECGSYHIHAEGVIVEFLNPDGTAAGPGELGSVVLTDLHNNAMPFFRYEIGDLGMASNEGCNCGRGLPVMGPPQGRDTDIIVTPDGTYIVDDYFDVLFRSAHVDQWQVIQHALDRLEIKIVRGDLFSDADIAHIEQGIDADVGDQLEVALTFVDGIPATRSGKRRYVISDVAREHFSPSPGRASE
ncbi:phenylacetate--CoA ligase family protein [Chloroflexota bacterium]